MNSIELCIISGFFGAGKTTLLRNILEESLKLKAGVLVNEFGKISIDGILLKREGIEMKELTNGSIFCACKKADFMEALVNFSNYDIDVLFVENSGLGDPSEMPKILEQMTPHFKRPYRYNGSICVVDSTAFLDVLGILVAIENQVVVASRIILNKIDLLTPEKLDEVRCAVRALNPTAELHETTFGQVSAKMLLGTNYLPAAERKCSNTTAKRPGSLVITSKGLFEEDKLRQLLEKTGPLSYRIKGFAPTHSGWKLVEYSGNNITISSAEFREEIQGLTIVFIMKKTFALKDLRNIWNEVMNTPAAFDIPV